MYIYVCVCVCVCIYIYTYTHTHTHTLYASYYCPNTIGMTHLKISSFDFHHAVLYSKPSFNWACTPVLWGTSTITFWKSKTVFKLQLNFKITSGVQSKLFLHCPLTQSSIQNFTTHSDCFGAYRFSHNLPRFHYKPITRLEASSPPIYCHISFKHSALTVPHLNALQRILLMSPRLVMLQTCS